MTLGFSYITEVCANGIEELEWYEAEKIPKITFQLWRGMTREELSKRTQVDEDTLYRILANDNRFVYDTDMPKGSAPVWHVRKEKNKGTNLKIRVECVEYLIERDKEKIKASTQSRMLNEKEALIRAWKWDHGYGINRHVHPDDYLKYRRWLDNTEKRLMKEYDI